MTNLTTTAILLLLAIGLLYLAVTDKLSRLLDAWDVAVGKSKTTQTSAANASGPGSQPQASSASLFGIPALPPIHMLTDAQVPFTYFTPQYNPLATYPNPQNYNPQSGQVS